jgi:GTPase Era involved in 16S rRNA processing
MTPFEIKVAIVGNKGSGKTTLLNSLLQDKYSHVGTTTSTSTTSTGTSTTTSTTGTQSSINCFRILPPHRTSDVFSSSAEAILTATTTAAETFEETKEQNESIRQRNPDSIHVNEFNLSLDKSNAFLEGRGDTSLVFVDIPGLDPEEMIHCGYKKYLKESWEDLSCLMYVSDLRNERQWNTSDKQLLAFIADLMKTKQIPMLVVGTKVDEPDDERVQLLLERARGTFRTLLESFETTDSDDASPFDEQEDLRLRTLSSMNTEDIFLDANDESMDEDILPPSDSADAPNSSLRMMTMASDAQILRKPPEFLWVSAKNAFPYRYASTLSKPELVLENDLLDRIGKEEVGRIRWNKLSPDERLETVYQVVSDEASCTERLASTNFPQFLSWLHDTIGSEQAQTELIQHQQEWNMRSLTSDSKIAHKIRQMHRLRAAKGESSDSLKATFWAFYRVSEEVAFGELDSNMNVSALARPISQLLDYADLLKETEWEPPLVVETALHALVKRQLQLIMGRHRSYSFSYWYRTMNTNAWQTQLAEDMTWELLSPPDWANIHSSILLVGGNRHFCERLGHEKIVMETLLQTSHLAIFKEPVLPSVLANAQRRPFLFGSSASSSGSTVTGSVMEADGFYAMDGCPSLQKGLDGYYDTKGIFHPKYPETFACLERIHPPQSLSDPNHWGHAAWRYMNYVISFKGE